MNQPIKAFLNTKRPLELWVPLFVFAGGLILGGFVPLLGIALGAAIFIGVAGALYVEKSRQNAKKVEPKKEGA